VSLFDLNDDNIDDADEKAVVEEFLLLILVVSK